MKSTELGNVTRALEYRNKLLQQRKELQGNAVLRVLLVAAGYTDAAGNKVDALELKLSPTHYQQLRGSALQHVYDQLDECERYLISVGIEIIDG